MKGNPEMEFGLYRAVEIIIPDFDWQIEADVAYSTPRKHHANDTSSNKIKWKFLGTKHIGGDDGKVDHCWMPCIASE